MTLMTDQMHKKVLGIIGGMGPQATVDLFQKIIDLTPAKNDQEHLHIIIDNCPQIPDRSAFVLGQSNKDPKPHLVLSALKLKNAGADFLIMPCNSAHIFLPYIKERVDISFISIVEACVEELRRNFSGARSVVVLSTTGTRKARIYDEALEGNGFRVLGISQEMQGELMDAIYLGVKGGRGLEYVDRFAGVLDIVERQLKPDVVIAACTEIPILLKMMKDKNIDTGLRIVDATLALARAAVKAAD
jgi:aspartate racemase